MNSLANRAVERKSNNESEKQEIVNSSGWVRSRRNSPGEIATTAISTDSDNAFLSGAATQDDADEEIAQVASGLRLLIGEGNVAELRALRVWGGGNFHEHKFGFFDSDHLEQMAQAALKLTQTAEGVYFTLNPVNKALLNRCWNGVGTARTGDVTTDADIVERRWLLVDADPCRPANVSATEDEKTQAHETIQQVRDYLTSQCWPLPVLADSGNGFHLLYRIDLPADDKQLVKRVLKALDERFSNSAVKIDPSVFNPSRIVKLYGTTARKGDNTAERPHRKSGLLESPSEPKVVSKELLEALAAEATTESSRLQTVPVIAPEVHGDREGVIRRARSYLSQIPGAIDGQHGHDQTFKAACILVRDFALPVEEAWPLILEWNQTCKPPWDEKDLRRKLTEADKKDGPRGGKLHNNAAAKDSGSLDAAVKQDDDPHRLARLFLKNRYTQDDEGTLRYWREEWWRWEAGSYRVLSEVELRAQLWADIEIEFNRINTERRSQRTSQVMAGEQPAGKPPRADKVSNSLVSNVLGALTGLTTLRNDIEQPSWLLDGQKSQRCNYIALRNGLLDVDAHLAGRKEVLKPHSPRWFSPVCLPYDYETNAQCSKWQAFLQKNLEEDAERIALLQEWFGYSLTVDTSRQRFLLLEGEGSNGKSVVCAVLTAVLGEGNVSHVPLEAFGERFALKQTLGKLANIASEVGEIDRVAEGKLKSFTSGDRMTFDRKGIDAIEALPTARLVLATNNRPRFSDRSGGVWRRMLLLPFHVEIMPKEKVYGMDQSSWWMEQRELPAIFNWAVEGLRRLRQQKRFTEPAVCQEAMREYRMECNPARTFLQEHCETKRDSSVETIWLYEEYSAWCKANNYHPLSSGMFGKEVGRVFPKAAKKRQGSRDSRQNVYEGIRYQGLSSVWLPPRSQR